MADVSQIRLPNGDTFDLIDEKSGYITAQYIENKTDYSIPVSRVGEIVVGETAIGTDSTNFPTSKAVVDYVDERVVQEIDAIDVGVMSVNGKTGSVALSASDVGAITRSDLNNELDDFGDYILGQIPASTSQLTNDSGFITSETDPTVPAWAKAATKPTYTAAEVGALPSDTVIPEDKIFIATYGTTTLAEAKTAYNAGKVIFAKKSNAQFTMLISYSSNSLRFGAGRNSNLTILEWTLTSDGWADSSYVYNAITNIATIEAGDYITFVDANSLNRLSRSNSLVFGTSTSQYLANNGTWQSIPSIPTNISAFTNDSGYLTSSDIASVLTYKGTKASYSALPSSGNSTGDVWHITDTGAEYAWDGSAWQELGTAIDVSGFVSKSGDTMSGNLDLDTNFLLFKNDNVSIKLTGTHYYQSNSDTTFYGVTFSSGMNDASILLRNIRVPFVDYDAANKKYVDDSIGALSIPTKTSDLTNDSGFITSYTDEKVKQESLNGVSGSRNILTTSSYQTTSTITNGAQYTRYIYLDDSSPYITVVDKTDSSKYTRLRNNGFSISTGTYQIMISAAVQTNIHQITLPDKDGTIALTSDIPQVYSSTNTGGYLTMATLPIYDGTVV